MHTPFVVVYFVICVAYSVFFSLKFFGEPCLQESADLHLSLESTQDAVKVINMQYELHGR